MDSAVHQFVTAVMQAVPLPVPYFIQNSYGAHMEVAELEDGRFHCFRRGEPAVLLPCSSAILMRSPLLDLLSAQCAASANFEPARIVQIATGETWSGYARCSPHIELTPADVITPEDARLPRIWHYQNRYLFLDWALADQVRKMEWSNELVLSAGFGGFAAIGK